MWKSITEISLDFMSCDESKNLCREAWKEKIYYCLYNDRFIKKSGGKFCISIKTMSIFIQCLPETNHL